MKVHKGMSLFGSNSVFDNLGSGSLKTLPSKRYNWVLRLSLVLPDVAHPFFWTAVYFRLPNGLMGYFPSTASSWWSYLLNTFTEMSLHWITDVWFRSLGLYNLWDWLLCWNYSFARIKCKTDSLFRFLLNYAKLCSVSFKHEIEIGSKTNIYLLF